MTTNVIRLLLVAVVLSLASPVWAKVRKALFRQRPTHVRTAVDQHAPPAVGGQHHVRLEVVSRQRMRGA